MDLTKMPWVLRLAVPIEGRVAAFEEAHKVGGLTLLQAAQNLDLAVLHETGNWLSAEPKFFELLAQIASGNWDVGHANDPGFRLQVVRRPSTPGHA